MAHITSRRHANITFNRRLGGAAFAVLMLPAASQAQPPAPAQTPAQTQTKAQTERTLPGVTVQAARTQRYKADAASAPTYVQPLVDTPQTIAVIRREVMAEQGAVTLTEALRNTPGVGAFFLGENGNTSTGDAVYMRGFDSTGSIFVDNVRDLGSISRDMFNIEQVEVLKGPAGADNGRGAPTGSINLVTKQPMAEDAFAADVAIGTAPARRATVDWNRVVDADRGLAFRLNAAVQDSGVAGRNNVDNKRWAIAPALVYGLGSPTRLTLNFLHVDQNNTPDGGVPTIGLPGYIGPDPERPFLGTASRVDTHNYYGLAADRDKVQADMATVRIEHVLPSGLTLQNTTRYGRTAQDYRLTSFMGSRDNLLTPVAADPAGWTLARSTNYKNQVNEILTNQTSLTADFATAGIGHTLVTGIEFTRDRQTNAMAAQAGRLPPANLYRPDPAAATPGYAMLPNGVNTTGETRTASAYLFDTLKLGGQFRIGGGVRLDRYATDFADTFQCGARRRPACAAGQDANTPVTARLNSAGTLFNWKLAGIFKPTADSSVYALYATSQQPPGGANFSLSSAANSSGAASSAANPAYAPQKTATVELGAKWDRPDRRLGVTAALFRTRVFNEIERDAASEQYFQTGEKQVDGIEAGAIGNLTGDWSVSAGYALMNSKVVSGAAMNADGTRNLAYTPRQSFTSWTAYRLPGGFTIGGGARFVDILKRTGGSASGTPQFANAYWVFDAMASYRVDKHLDLQLNLYNLGNKQYVTAINKSGYRYTPGTQRSALLTAHYRF